MLPWSLAILLMLHDLHGAPELWILIAVPVVVFGVYGFRYRRLTRGGDRDKRAEPGAA